MSEDTYSKRGYKPNRISPKVRPGRAFEARVKRDCEATGLYAVKIPEGCRMLGTRAIPHKTCYDYLVIGDGFSAAFECKECGDNTFNFKSKVLDKKKVHQFNSLREAKRYGLYAGYLIHFTEHEKICWLPMETLDMMLQMGKKSAHHSELASVSDKNTLLLTRLFADGDPCAQG